MPVTDNPEMNVYDIRLVKHEDGWIYGTFCAERKDITKPDLYASDELFLTGTGAEIIGIVDIDGKTIGNGKPGPVTKLLREKFFEYAQGKG